MLPGKEAAEGVDNDNELNGLRCKVSAVSLYLCILLYCIVFVLIGLIPVELFAYFESVV